MFALFSRKKAEPFIPRQEADGIYRWPRAPKWRNESDRVFYSQGDGFTCPKGHGSALPACSQCALIGNSSGRPSVLR